MNGSQVRLGVVMDPIQTIQVKKDSTLAMLLAAQARGWQLHYMEPQDLWLTDGRVHAASRPLTVRDDPRRWFELGSPEEHPLATLDVVLMRKDPPFDMEYVYSTYLLDLAAAEGCLVVNRPASLRDANEKLYTAWFPQCCPPSLVTRNPARIRDFMARQGEIVVKPLDGMGGASVFRLIPGDTNIGVILETVTDHGRRSVMAQRFLPEYRQGDKRILLVDGEPVPYALARIPAEGEGRANLAAGGRGEGVPLTERDRWICSQVGPTLREKGLMFVGLDVIGDYLTEINVTSPTCIRELDAQFGLDIGGQLMDAIAGHLGART
ncbi:glutathione synthase [Ectothiorhodospira shaposhnikovii]|uniref:glutathione synthase n=1 Tax=Ectothiorhodospira shaposhnikovii TaxID=1054 RepID=UPI0039A0DE1A